jgi:hypothetical protein
MTFLSIYKAHSQRRCTYYYFSSIHCIQTDKTGRLVSTRQPSMEGGMEGHVGHLCIPLISYSNYMSLNMHNYSALFGQSMVSHSLHCSIHVVAFLEFVYLHSLADLWLPKGCTTPARTGNFLCKILFSHHIYTL